MNAASIDAATRGVRDLACGIEDQHLGVGDIAHQLFQDRVSMTEYDATGEFGPTFAGINGSPSLVPVFERD